MTSTKRHRKCMRWSGYDYSAPGWYDVTICLDPRMCLLGRVRDDATVELSAFGTLVLAEIERLSEQFPNVRIDTREVMPDHVHLIIVIERWVDSVTLSKVVGCLKRRATVSVNALRGTPGAPFFQRGFFDRVLRDHDEVVAAREYIRLNPVRWLTKHRKP